MGFRDADFFQDHFHVARWWVVGAIVGGMPPLVSFVVSAVLLRRLKGLWAASEQSPPSWEMTDWG